MCCYQHRPQHNKPIQCVPLQYTCTCESWWRCWQDKSHFLPSVPHWQAALDVISEIISLWCVGSMAPLVGSFISLFSTPPIRPALSAQPSSSLSRAAVDLQGVITSKNKNEKLWIIISNILSWFSHPLVLKNKSRKSKRTTGNEYWHTVFVVVEWRFAVCIFLKSIYLSIHPFIYLSIYPSIYIWVVLRLGQKSPPSNLCDILDST